MLPRWGGLKLDRIKPVAVEEWLGGIKRAKATRAKIRNLMSALFSHATRYEWTDKNSIKLVRQSAKRERIPDVLELGELQLLLTKLDTRERTLVLLAASPTMKGEQPYWPDNLMKRHIKPVARANGIYKNIGWHTFRHTFGTLLKANGEDVKTVQELLRHANSRITLEVYTQAVTPTSGPHKARL